MSRFRKGLTRAILLVLLGAGTAQAQKAPVAMPSQPAATAFPHVGRPATAKEVKAWDIDVRPDFKGLPSGSGSVAKGQDIWEAKCAMCHGIFGESNEVFSPLIGGTTKEDIASGKVARLLDEAYPQRTTIMKVPTVSTLWDYIYRAMPWNQPKSLSPDEVYAVTAFMLNLAGVVPDDFVMSDKNIAQVQQRMPNRNGISQAHAMWPGKLTQSTARPDLQGSNCMRNCKTESKIASYLPDHARSAHGNLADQNRIIGPQRGALTQAAAPAGGTAAAGAPPKPANASAEALALLASHSCLACHNHDAKIVGPSYQEVAKRYAGKADAVSYLSARIKAGGSGVWGPVPMPPQNLSEAEARKIADWIAAGAPRP